MNTSWPAARITIMELKYLRVQAFVWLKGFFAPWARRGRMKQMVLVADLQSGMSVLDLGGTPEIWLHSFIPGLKITILNLPGNLKVAADPQQHHFDYQEGDACNLANIPDRSFDLVFSNSVIEHVGGPERQAAFAREVRRIGKTYWVQTPAIWFPIEAHCGMPFWWFYPKFLQRRIIAGWRRKLPDWSQMVAETTVLKRAKISELFPDAHLLTERVGGIPKSYSAFKL
jgi:hypothetical protein